MKTHGKHQFEKLWSDRKQFIYITSGWTNKFLPVHNIVIQYVHLDTISSRWIFQWYFGTLASPKVMEDPATCGFTVSPFTNTVWLSTTGFLGHLPAASMARKIASVPPPGEIFHRQSKWRPHLNIWMFPKIVVPRPQIIHFYRVFHYKPSILGYPYFWKHPYEIVRIKPRKVKKKRLDTRNPRNKPKKA